MVNKVILVGRLTSDPELRTSAAGVQVAKLRLATNTYGGKDEQGVRKEHAEFHSLVLFGRQAEVASDYLRKGKLLYAEGRLQTSSWEDAEGKKQRSTEVIVDAFQMLGPRQTEEAAA